jgi:hypothetical protein
LVFLILSNPFLLFSAKIGAEATWVSDKLVADNHRHASLIVCIVPQFGVTDFWRDKIFSELAINPPRVRLLFKKHYGELQSEY